MDAIIAFLPNIASGIVMLIGLICFFKPQITKDMIMFLLLEELGQLTTT